MFRVRACRGGPILADPAAESVPCQAWDAYDRWQQDPRIELLDEPAEIEARFRALTRLRQPATKDWADAYLAAFATVGQLTLVTFDRGLRAKIKSTVVLG